MSKTMRKKGGDDRQKATQPGVDAFFKRPAPPPEKNTTGAAGDSDRAAKQAKTGAGNAAVSAAATAADSIDAQVSQSDLYVWRIVLTGGPCAGKSTALSLLKDRLLGLGYHVITVPENATAIFANIGGYDPTWATDREKHCVLQQTLLQNQMDSEKHFLTLARLRSKKTVVLYDRGVLDIKAFMEPQEWSNMLKNLNFTEAQLRDDRYDMVVHMVSAAIGAPQFYEFGPGSRNPERFHDAAAAARADKQGLAGWTGHPQLKIIDNSTDFGQKVERTLGAIVKCLGEPVVSRQRHRFRVAPVCDEDFPESVHFETALITIDYLQQTMPGLVTSIRKRNQNNTFTFAQRDAKGCESVWDGDVMTPDDESLRGTVREQRITESQYEFLLQQRKGRQVQKHTRSFVFDNLYWELHTYMTDDASTEVEFRLDCEADSKVENIPSFVKRVSGVAPETAHRRSGGGNEGCGDDDHDDAPASFTQMLATGN